MKRRELIKGITFIIVLACFSVILSETAFANGLDRNSYNSNSLWDGPRTLPADCYSGDTWDMWQKNRNNPKGLLRNRKSKWEKWGVLW